MFFFLLVKKATKKRTNMDQNTILFLFYWFFLSLALAWILNDERSIKKKSMLFSTLIVETSLYWLIFLL